MRVTAAHVAVVAAFAPVVWAAANPCDREVCAGGGVTSLDDVTDLRTNTFPAELFSVGFLQLEVAKPDEEDSTGRLGDMLAIVSTTVNRTKVQFLERVRRRIERGNYSLNMTAALARQRLIPIIDGVLGGVIGSAYNTTFITIAGLIKSTLDGIQSAAVDLLNTCLAFRDSLLESVPAAAGSAWDALSSRVDSFVGIFMPYWLSTLQTLQFAVPVLTEMLSGFGYESVAEPFSKTMFSVLQIADQITAQIYNTSATVIEVANQTNASAPVLDPLLARIENVTSEAVATATRFGAQLQDALMGLIIDLARRITGVKISVDTVSNASAGSVEGAVADLEREVENITETLTDAVDSVFTGINEAAALATVRDLGGAMRAGFVLPLLCGLAILSQAA